jgi:hypothetical protein
VTVACRPLKARQAKDRARRSGVPTTEIKVDLKSDILKVRVGTRSVSKILHRGCSITAYTIHAAALSSMVKRQSFHSVNSGPNAPARSRPAGTAVCLRENTRGK